MKAVKITVRILLMISTLFITSVSGMAEETIRLTAGEWSPYLSSDLKYYGIAGRIITEAFLLKGVKVKFEFYPWKRAYSYAERGELDGTAMWLKNPEREKAFYFSDPVIEEKHVFFHLKSYPLDWKTADDLKGIKLGGLLGFSYGSMLDEALNQKKITMDRTARDVLNFRKLLKGRIQVYPQDLNVGYEIIRNNFLPGEYELFTHHNKPLYTQFTYLLLSKNNKENNRRIELFNSGLKHLKDTGKFEQYINEARAGAYHK